MGLEQHHAKEYGFIFPSSENYDGLSAVYDYGQNGAELKNNIKQYLLIFGRIKISVGLQCVVFASEFGVARTVFDPRLVFNWADRPEIS